MRVAGLQMDIAWEDVGTNLERAAEMAGRAAAAGARLLVLPEMFATGFTQDIKVALEATPATYQLLADLARAHGVFVAGGIVEPAPDLEARGGGAGPQARAYNTCVVLNPEGHEVLRYRKAHAFTLAREHECIQQGDALLSAAVDETRVTALICYDLRFPEVFRPAARQTDLYLVIASWPEVRSHAWRTLLVARAIENQAWVLGVNRVGTAQGHAHRGDSMLVDPMGEVVASRACSEGLVLGEVDVEAARRSRERLGFLEDRRPELYAALERESGARSSGGSGV